MWEIRGSNTTKRGTILLAESGSGEIKGEVTLRDSFAVSMQELTANMEKHKIIDVTCISYKRPHAWVFENPIKYDTPIPYKHPQGAVIWVNIDIDV